MIDGVLLMVKIEEGLHECRKMKMENNARARIGETSLSVFKDVDSGRYTLRVGMEFVEIHSCPFCGEKL